MRFHAHYPLLQAWLDVPNARALMRAEHLAIARFEPAMFYTRGGAILDLIFAGGEAISVIPNIEVSPEMLLEYERTPLIWPSAAAALGETALHAIAELVLPWLESLTLARQANDEAVRRFSGAIPGERFERARAAKYIGAARYEDCLSAAAPYVYAARFGPEKNIAVRDPFAASGAALLAARGAAIRADLGDTAANNDAAQWFSREIFGGVADGRYEVAVQSPGDMIDAGIRITLDVVPPRARAIRVPGPIPVDVMLSFDPEDAEPVREFGVEAPEPPLRDAVTEPGRPAVGGSSGKILLLMREDFTRAPDADVDGARSLAARLRAEGFEAELAAPSTLREDAHADLVHAFTVERPALDALKRFRQKGTPAVLSPHSPPHADEADFGPKIVRALFSNTRDEGALEEQLWLFERRRLRSDVEAEATLGEACGLADVLLAQSTAEEARLREIAGAAVSVLRCGPYLPMQAAAPDAIGPIVGNAPFIFMHAPVEWRSNLPFLARVAARRRTLLVVAGPAVEADALIHARALASESFVHLAAPSEGEIEALYRSARVYADVSWHSRGAHRIARAAASGCGLLLSRTSAGADLYPGAILADPASEAAIEAALERAWRGAAAVPAAESAPEPFTAVIAAYAQAQQSRQPA